jgi:hypothetical protein
MDEFAVGPSSRLRGVELSKREIERTPQAGFGVTPKVGRMGDLNAKGPPFRTALRMRFAVSLIV